MDRQYKKIGPKMSVISQLDSSAFSPSYGFQAEIRESNLPPTATLLFKVCKLSCHCHPCNNLPCCVALETVCFIILLDLLAIVVLDFCRSLISKVNFSVLTKCWALILLSKLLEHYAILEKWIKCIH